MPVLAAIHTGLSYIQGCDTYRAKIKETAGGARIQIPIRIPILIMIQGSGVHIYTSMYV